MKTFKEILKNLAEKNNIFLNENNILQFDYFRKQLLSWNDKMNLTNITDAEDFASKHIIDSLMLCKEIDIKSGDRVIDVGTGPGIPGLIIKMFKPDIKIVLLESVGKKTKFLKWIVEDMNLTDVEVVNDRAENLARNLEYREKFDITVARAVAALNTLSELCLPFVKVSGLFVAMKGMSPEEEINMARRAINILGGSIKEIKTYAIKENMKRSLIIIYKNKECPSKYPRRPGVPGKNPL